MLFATHYRWTIEDRFLTLVLDLQTDAILFVGQSKEAESLQPFWRWLRAARAEVQSPSTCGGS